MAATIPRPRVAFINRYGQVSREWIRYFDDLVLQSTGVINLATDVVGVLSIANGGTGSVSGPLNLSNANIAAAAAIAWSKISKAGSSLADLATRNASDLSTAQVAYSPLWTGSVSNPAIGNGSLTGFYTRIGGVDLVTVSLSIGSTTTFGSGDWSFSLPRTTTSGHLLPARIVAAGVATFGVTAWATGSTFQVLASGGVVGSGTPGGWTTGDSINATAVVNV